MAGLGAEMALEAAKRLAKGAGRSSRGTSWNIVERKRWLKRKLLVKYGEQWIIDVINYDM